jgi:hypothetical protein
MYYKDLSKYEYLESRNEIENILNVGWLDLVHPFPKGRELSKKFYPICCQNVLLIQLI